MSRMEYLEYIRKVIAERGGKAPTFAEFRKAQRQTQRQQKQTQR